jgi:two-component system sensor histidine kinase SenX3
MLEAMDVAAMTATTDAARLAIAIGATATAGAIATGLGVVLGRRSGRQALRQRIEALASRLGEEGGLEERGVEPALMQLEKATDMAAEAVAEASSDAIRLRRALDTLQMGIVVCDESGEIVFRNACAASMLDGRHSEALVAQALVDLIAEAWTKGTAEHTLELYGPPRKTLHLKAETLDDGRRSIGVAAAIENISERRHLEEVRRDFVANVSHELKTPMGALGLLAETLLSEDDPSVAKRLADRIHHEAIRVGRIVEDLLDLSRIEDQQAPSKELVRIGPLINESIDRVSEVAHHKGVEIVFEEPPLPVATLGDRRQLLSAVYNLIENAVKFSYEDGKVEVTVTQDAPSAMVEIQVKDHGIGIPTRDLDRIFERFYRVDAGRSRETGGTGLGLAIVRHVAANHQGEIKVVSREGEGATFTLRLPMAPPGDLE